MSARAATSAGVGASSIGDLPQRALEAELARLLLGQRPVLAVEAAAPDDDVHAEAGGAADHLPADAADAEQRRASGRRGPRAFEYSFLFHLPARSSATLSGMRRSSARISAERQLGDRDRVLARAVRDVDAARRGGGDVDGVVAGAGADDQRQPAGVEHRRGDLRAAHDEHVGAGRARSPRSARRPSGRLVEDLAAGGLQAVEAALLRTCRRPGLSSVDADALRIDDEPAARRAAWARTRWTSAA